MRSFVVAHCHALALALEKGAPGEVYQIGDDRELSNRRLTELLLAALVDRKQTWLEDGLALTVQWFHECRTWSEPLRVRAAL